ncbi:MAG: M56 family metallopeptidase [Carboxylicivirga sp.]|jgi:hypothetical protein|nr:M56 family metallopeptidase [Carboxylicivirga sp.]
MTPFLIWLTKSTFCISVLYLVFKLTISRDNAPGRNRLALLSIVLLSLILPFVNVPIFRAVEVVPPIHYFNDYSKVTLGESAIYPTDASMESPVEVSNPVNYWIVFYLSIVSLIAFHVLFSLGQLWRIIRSASHHNAKGKSVMIVDKRIQPFSFFSHIIMSSNDFKNNKDMIIRHEYAHVKYCHWIDLLLLKFICILHWFNPMVWLMLREIKLVHEFQADQFVLGSGVDAKRYQLLILEKAVGERQFAMANHFSQKPILKRINMMNKKSIQKWKSLKILVFVPVVVLILQAFSSPENVISSALDKLSTIVSTEENYDVVMYDDQLKVFNQLCDLESLESKIINHPKFKDNEDVETIKVLAFNDVSWERVAEVQNMLYKIPYKMISTTIVENKDIPEPDMVNRILLQSNGLVRLNGEEYSLPEFKKQLNHLGVQAKSGKNRKSSNVVFDVEEGIGNMEVSTIKNLVRSFGLKQVGPSVQQRWTQRSMRANIILGGDVKWCCLEQDDSSGQKKWTYKGETIFTVGWTGKLCDLELLQQYAIKFVEKDDCRSAVINPGEGSDLAVITDVKNILKEAGFKDIEVSE